VTPERDGGEGGWPRPGRAARRRAGGGPRPVSSSLPEVARLLGTPGAFELGVLSEHWESLVGLQLASHCSPRSLEGGVLVVVADGGAWAAELRFLSAALLAKVRQMAPTVRSVVVRVGT